MPIFFFNATATTKIYTLSLHDALPIYWGPPQAGWYDKSKAAAVMYTEFRNPLVHELAADKAAKARPIDRKSTRLNSSHRCISYAVFCLKKKIARNKSS